MTRGSPPRMVFVVFVGFILSGAPILLSEIAAADSSTVIGAVLPAGRYWANAAWVGGSAYILGGQGSSGTLNQIVRFTPSTNAVATMSATLPSVRVGASAVSDGTNIYIFGGSFNTQQNEILRYTPSTDTITTLSSPLPSWRSRTSAIWDGSNAYIFGGAPSEGPYLNEILRFNPASGQVTRLSAVLPSGTSSSTAIWDGSNAYVFGGDSNTGRQIVRFTPSTGAVAVMASSLPLPVVDSSVIFDGSSAYIFGGWRAGQNVNPIVRYTPMTDSVSQLSTTLPSGRRGTSGIWDGSNGYVFGGWDGTALNQIIRYTPDAPPPNSPPSCMRDSPGESIQVQIGEAISFRATCTDVEGRWQGNAWNLDGNPDGASDPPPSATSWTTQRTHSWSTAGSHSLVMAAHDHLGLDSNVVSWDITVAGGSVPQAAPAPPSGTSPGAPSQASPASITTLTPTLTWSASNSATTYFVNIRKMSDDTLIADGQNVGNVVSWQVPASMLEPGQTYKWAVQAGNAAGVSAQSTPIYIRTPQAPPPTIIGMFNHLHFTGFTATVTESCDGGRLVTQPQTVDCFSLQQNMVVVSEGSPKYWVQNVLVIEKKGTPLAPEYFWWGTYEIWSYDSAPGVTLYCNTSFRYFCRGWETSGTVRFDPEIGVSFATMIQGGAFHFTNPGGTVTVSPANAPLSLDAHVLTGPSLGFDNPAFVLAGPGNGDAPGSVSFSQLDGAAVRTFLITRELGYVSSIRNHKISCIDPDCSASTGSWTAESSRDVEWVIDGPNAASLRRAAGVRDQGLAYWI